MKQIKPFIFGVLAITLSGMIAIAGETPRSSTKSILREKKTNQGIKRAPSRLFVECVYENGYLHFNATFSYTYMNVSISDEDNGSVVYQTITPADNIVMFDADNGVYEITAESDNGNTFTGTLKF